LQHWLSTDSLAGVKLLDYLKSQDRPARRSFAAGCGTSVEYLFLIAYGKRTPKVALAVAIERESAGAVRCDTLLPDVDWHYLRSAQGSSAA
jgi:DNA-binding transcriptional regulator YdaS (Cro superfamily)